MPDGAVRAGHDKDGGTLFIGRAYFETDVLPAKIVPNHGAAYVSFAGQEHQVMHYEVNNFSVFRLNAELGWLALLFRFLKVPGPHFSPKTLYPHRGLLFHL